MHRHDLLLEIGCEELPAPYVEPALTELKEQGERLLKEARLNHHEATIYGTPRRLTLFIKDLAERQKDVEGEVKGPKAKAAFANGQPTSAAKGFAKAHGVDVKSLFLKETGKGEYTFLKKRSKGQPTEEILPQLLPKMIRGISFPRTMRWGPEEIPFARPIRWLLALYGEKVVDFTFSGVRGNNRTWGLRFFYPHPVVVKRPSNYLESLRRVGVIADHRERREMIERQLMEIAAEYHITSSFNEELIEENTFLVEYPTAFVGQYDQGYLELPKDVLKNAMQEHQRYFPLETGDGRLRPYFIGIRNGGKEALQGIIQGNEQVIEARLSDARFFFHEDQKKSLEERVEELKKVLFHEDLGTLHHKLERMSYLATDLSREIGFSKEREEKIKRAVRLCKADLTTEMVKEFPKLQGIIGEEYALLMGEEEEVAQAIGEHYRPRFSGDELPATEAGSVLSLVDKLDSIVSFFSIGLLPKSSQDPYALRRQAQGMIRIMVEEELDFSLVEFVKTNMKLLQGQDHVEGGLHEKVQSILSFFKGRFERYLLEKGFDYDLVGSLLEGEVDSFYQSFKKMEVLKEFREEGRLTPLVIALTRAWRLSKKMQDLGEIQKELLTEESELNLYSHYRDLTSSVEESMNRMDYRGTLIAMESIIEPIDRFFDEVLVMVEDEELRDNRLLLLKKIASYYSLFGALDPIVIEDKEREKEKENEKEKEKKDSK